MSWFDDKELSIGVGAISWDFLKKIKLQYYLCITAKGNMRWWRWCLQLETMAVEMEDWIIALSPNILWPDFFSNTCLKTWRTAHNNTNINIAPFLWYIPKNICDKTKERESRKPSCCTTKEVKLWYEDFFSCFF